MHDFTPKLISKGSSFITSVLKIFTLMLLLEVLDKMIFAMTWPMSCTFFDLAKFEDGLCLNLHSRHVLRLREIFYYVKDPADKRE